MKRMLRGMGAVLLVSMVCTEGLLLTQGRAREAIPLHLCSISAMLALAAAWGKVCQHAMDYLWYIGLPGALLALVFPSPAQSAYQGVFTASYMVTHGMIVLIVGALMFAGIRPKAGRTARVMLLLQGMAFVAFMVNETLDTNFLFLNAPPVHSPLEAVYESGYGVYVLALEGLMLALCLVQSGILRAIEGICRN